MSKFRLSNGSQFIDLQEKVVYIAVNRPSQLTMFYLSQGGLRLQKTVCQHVFLVMETVG